MRDHFTIVKDTKDLTQESPRRRLIFRFLMSPENYSNNQLTCSVNRLVGQTFKQKAEPTNEKEQIATDLLVSSIGFKSVPLDPSQFDMKTHVVHNENGCVVRNNKVDIGCYVAGWSKTGAKGVIDSTLLGCEETINNIRIHHENGLLEDKPPPTIDATGTLSFDDYVRVREEELRRGKAQGKDRLKMSPEEILRFI